MMKSKSPSPVREKSREHRSPVRQRLYRGYHAFPRAWRNSLIALLSIYLIHSLTHTSRHIYNAHLRQLPTDFTALARQTTAEWKFGQAIRHGNTTHVDDRYVFMRHLGQGAEGKAAIYVDTENDDLVVVKTYNDHRGRLLPKELLPRFHDLTHYWKNEIEASLRFEQWRPSRESELFVPVRDYFILQHDRSWQWAFVTPFIEGGTLLNLAKKIRASGYQTSRELDQIYRPMLHQLLDLLSSMHEQGYCHDDIKPDNIFVRSSRDWLLGDLGQVRHLSHEMHSSQGWKDRNQWADCRINDVRRLLKTYIAFLRRASADQAEFDRAFLESGEAWSKLYWEWMRKPVSAQETTVVSKKLDSESLSQSVVSSGRGEGACITRKVGQELMCTRLHTQWRDYVFAFQC